MEINQLFQFKTMAECRTMTEAAERLHISQPALSIMLKKMEEELGVRLFNRKKNKIVLNGAGELALTHAKDILNRIDNMKQSLAEYERKDYIYTVGFCDPGLLWYCTPSFSMTYPDYEMKSQLYAADSDEYELLKNGIYDIVMTDKKITRADVVCIPFIEDRVLLSVSKNSAMARKKSISLRELQNITVAMFYVGGSFYAKQEPFYRSLSPNLILELFDDYFLFQQRVQHTDIPTFTTELVRHYRDDGCHRTLIQLIDQELSTCYYVTYLKKNITRLRQFLKWGSMQSPNLETDRESL